MPPSAPAVVTTHHPLTNTSTTTIHVPTLRTPNTSDPNVQQGALYGAAAVALTGGVAFGLYQLYQYYTARTTQYKLTYFNLRALAETSRYLFALSHTEYVDHRFPDPPANSSARPGFDEIKDSLPFGQVPVLQIGGDNGVVISQSKAIERFLARRFGLMGSNDVETALVESIGEALVDCRNAYRKLQDNPSQDKAGFWTGPFHTTMRYINRLANQHSKSADRNTLVGSGITLADAQLSHFLSFFDDQVSISKVVDQFPVVKASRANFGSQPEIAAWIVKRPNTQH